MIKEQTPDINYILEVGQAMASINVPAADLDAAVGEMTSDLAVAMGIDFELDIEHARASLGMAMALTAAVQSIKDVNCLELLMQQSGFLDPDDHEDIKTFKAYALDRALGDAIEFEGSSMAAGAGDAVGRLQLIRAEAADLLMSKGYSVHAYHQACI